MEKLNVKDRNSLKLMSLNDFVSTQKAKEIISERKMSRKRPHPVREETPEKIEPENALVISFQREERSFRKTLRDKFSTLRYSHVKLSFEDEKLDQADSVLFDN